MTNVVIVGTQWGDEGKGKVVDLLTERFDIVARSQGGHNAGHTVIIDGSKYVLHLIPSGILHRDKVCVIGNGVIVDPEAMIQELEMLRPFGVEGRLFISDRCHLIMPYHNRLETAEESRLGDRRIGTTSRGIGPCYEDKIGRRGIRLGELAHPRLFAAKVRDQVKFKNRLLAEIYQAEPVDPEQIIDAYLGYSSRMLPFVTDTAEYLAEAIGKGRRVLFEGAQGTLLDVDHGTYPFVTSSNATAGGACTGTGVGPSAIGGTIGISKAYTTRVGGGPFPTEMDGEMAELVRGRGSEFGASTGRPRRCGWFDAVVAGYSCRINRIDTMVITKLDVLDELAEIQVCTGYRYGGEILNRFPATLEVLEEVEPVYETHPGWRTPTLGLTRYEELPLNARSYLARLSELLGADISIVSTGPGRDQTVVRQDTAGFSLIEGR